MADITIIQKDAAYIVVKCEQGIFQELSDHFTFFVATARYDVRFKNKMWDGKIRLLSAKTHELYCGLKDRLIKIAIQAGYTVDDQTPTYPAPSIQVIDKFIEHLNMPFELRDYQRQTVIEIITERIGTKLIPTAGGKTLVMYVVAQWYAQQNKKVVIIVPNLTLVNQTSQDFLQYSNNTVEMKILAAGQPKILHNQITLATWQILQHQPAEYFHDIDCIIGDEVHTFSAKSLKNIAVNSINAYCRFGCSGTLDDVQVNQLVIEGLFGNIKQVITTSDLFDRGTISQLQINAITLDYNKHTCQQIKTKKLSYFEEIDIIIASQRRLQFIGNLVSSLSGNVLVLYRFVEKHGVPLFNLLEAMLPDRMLMFVDKEVSGEQRTNVRNILETIDNGVVVASFKTFATGVNINRLNHVVIAAPILAKVTLLQSIGRSLRLHDQKQIATVWDIGDNLSCKGYVNYCMKHFNSRLLTYDQQKFNYTIDRHNIGEI